MDSKTTFVKTPKGEDEVRNRSAHLVGDIKRALLMVDGTATFGEISKRVAPSLRSVLDEMFAELERGGFIQDKLAKDKARFGGAHRMVSPLKTAVPPNKPADEGAEELDFTSMFRAPSAEMLAAEAKKAETAKLRMVVEAKARAEAEAKTRALAEAKEKQEAEAARIKIESEANARKEIEAARLKAQREVEEARFKAEREAAKVREEVELAKRKALAEAKLREEAERRAREEAEAARAKAEQEAARVRAELEAAIAKAEAEAKARQEIEAAKLRAQREAVEARLKAEREAAKAREEAELAKRKALAEARAREEAELAKRKALAEARAHEEAERRAKEEAEAVRVKAEREAVRARAELETANAKAEAEAKAKAEAERRMREEAEAAKLKAQQEAEVVRLKVEQETAKAREDAELARQKAVAEAKAREEAELRAKEETEAMRVKAEQEAARARIELEAAVAKAEAEVKAREEAERRLQEEAEAAKLIAQQEVEAVRLKAGQEAAKAHEEMGRRAKQEAEAMLLQREGAAKLKLGILATARSSSVTVLFFDVVGYTKQTVNKQIEIKKQFNKIVTDCLGAQGDDERIILDTGDGAAIGFLQHPEDALEVAMQFRETVMSNQHKDYPDLNVRIGIHLGPVNIVKDMNGQSNMVGDGINDAQRVMSFAGVDQIYISRPYYDFVSRLSDEYAGLFQYRDLQKDKHGREHPVYELMDAAAPVAQAVLPQAAEPDFAIKLEPFNFTIPEAATPHAPLVAVHEEPEQEEAVALMGGIEEFKLPEESGKPVEAAQAAQQQAVQQHQLPAGAQESPPVSAVVRPVAEVRMPSAEEVAKLAETQAKAWAQAEQRAAEAHRVSAERAAQPREVPRPTKEAPAARGRHGPMPWGKIGAGLLVALLIALFAVPPLMPTQGYATSIEQLLTASLQQPVHIGQLSGRLLPAPRLELKNVSIGETKPIQAQRAQVDFALSALFSSNKPITGIELEGVQVNGAALAQISAWLQQIAAAPQYPVARIGLNQGKLEAGGVQLSGVSGELDFNQAGKFVRAKLQAEGGKFVLGIDATPENKIQVLIAVRGSALPLLPNWVFDELDAKGELTGDSLVITGLDSRIMGGILTGDARIDWHSGWRAQGALSAKAITLQNMSKALAGDMGGTARFQMQSASLDKLVEAATLEGNFAVMKGVINGVDVVEMARLRSMESSPGGRTRFDELSGDLYYANGDYHFRQVKMSTGVLNATATLDIVKQQVSGRVIADLTMRAGMEQITLQAGGTSDNPSLRAMR